MYNLEGALDKSNPKEDYSRPKKWAKHQAILEYTKENGIRKELPPTKTLLPKLRGIFGILCRWIRAKVWREPAEERNSDAASKFPIMWNIRRW